MTDTHQPAPSNKSDTPPDLPTLLTLLHDRDWKVVKAVVTALNPFGPAAVPPLIEALHDSNWRIRWRAAIALGEMGQIAVPGLLQALRHQNVTVRRAAAFALRWNRDALPGLLDALHDPSPRVRWEAAWVLAHRHATIPDLVEDLHDANPDVRRTAARILGRTLFGAWEFQLERGGGHAAISALILLLSDTEVNEFGWRVCDAAAEALERIRTSEALAAVHKWREEQREA